MKQPVLVRIVRDVAAGDIPGMIGALNADFTNRRDPANLAANRGSRVGERTHAAFAGINDQTVSAYLDSPNVAVKVLQAMVADGALQNTDLPGLYDFTNDKWLGDGRNSGKAQIEQALFGAILPDSRLLDDLSDGMKRKLVRALPGLIRLRRNNSPELASLFEAIALHNEFQAFKDSPEAKGLKPAGKLELFRKPDMANVFTGEVPPEKNGPAWDMFLELNSMRSQREVADYFTRKADELTGTGRGLFSLAQSPIETLYQDENPEIKTAPVISVDPSLIVDDDGKPVNIRNRDDLGRWLRKRYQGREVMIADDGTIQRFTGKRLEASTKRRGEAQRQMYAALDSLLESAVYDGFEPADAKHPKLLGQNVYYAAADLRGEYYAIRFKVDMPKTAGQPSYKDHKITEIKIAPSLYRTESREGSRTQNEGAITRVSLPVLKRDVNPSYVDLGTLYQSAAPAVRSDMDQRYFAALDAGDMEAAQKIVDDQARKNGYITDYDYRMNHKAPNSHDQDVTVNLKNVKDGNLVPADYWTHPQYYQHSPDEFASFHAVKRAVENNFKRIVMYRAVPKNVKETAFRNGDWITPSLAYAKGEGAGIPGGYRIQRNSVDLEHVWWDGNSINEFGYDDGKEYAYKNTTNNRKLTDAVVRDLDGNMVPPSKRFNMRAVNIFYQSQAADGPENNRGSITFPRFAGGATVIHLFQNADVSTVIHELNHGKWTPRKLLRESNGGLLDSLKKSTKSPLEGNPEFVNLALKPAEGPICKNHDPGGASVLIFATRRLSV